MRNLPRVQHGVSAARCGLAAGMRSRLQRLLLALPFLFGLLIVPAAAGAPLSTGDGGWAL